MSLEFYKLHEYYLITVDCYLHGSIGGLNSRDSRGLKNSIMNLPSRHFFVEWNVYRAEKPDDDQTELAEMLPQSQADTTLAVAELGHAPRYSFEDGLRVTLEWYRKQHAGTA